MNAKSWSSRAVDPGIESVLVVTAFIACQVYVVLFIALHDWIPLGRLSNPEGIRAVDSKGKLIATTVLSTLPFAVGLAGSLYYASVGFPGWLWWLLWISYGAGLYGMLRAWWLPYLLFKDPARAARYQARFAHTHAFLPERNGIRPDTLHVTFHAVLVTLVILLAILSVSQDSPLSRQAAAAARVAGREKTPIAMTTPLSSTIIPRASASV